MLPGASPRSPSRQTAPHVCWGSASGYKEISLSCYTSLKPPFQFSGQRVKFRVQPGKSHITLRQYPSCQFATTPPLVCEARMVCL